MKKTIIGAFDAKTHLSQLLDRVEQGEQVEITRRGRPVARLVPYETRYDGGKVEALLARVREERGIYGVSMDDIGKWKQKGRK